MLLLISSMYIKGILKQNLFLKGFTVFAGFNTKVENEEIMQKLRREASGRLHILQLDVTSEHDIHSTFLYINENLPDGAPGLKLYFFKINRYLL